MKYSTEYWSLSHGSGPSAGIAYDRSRLPLSISVTVNRLCYYITVIYICQGFLRNFSKKFFMHRNSQKFGVWCKKNIANFSVI